MKMTQMGTSSYLPIKTLCYGYAAIPSEKAIFNAGSHVYFHANSGLISNNASLNINGSKSNSTSLKMKSCLKAIDFSLNMPMFRTRDHMAYRSTNNTINHLTIKNATIGLLIQNNDGTTVSIKNTQIYNSSNYGILAQTAKINGENVVTAGSGLACSYGGNYKFTHSTFNN
jgi:galactose mutarotase-like enzyme